MTDLRADLIEALMQREFSHDDEVDANLALDTVLDTLADRADEWGLAYWGDLGLVGEPSMEEGEVSAIAGRLIAVLRGDT